MKSKLLLIITFLLTKIAVGQEISKSDITKLKIKSMTTIDGDGKIKYTEFYNDKGDFVKQCSLNDSQQLHTDRELFYNDSLQLVEERIYTSNGDINGATKYHYNGKNQLSRKESISFGKVDAR